MVAIGGATADNNVFSWVCSSYWIVLMFAAGRSTHTFLKVWFLCLLTPQYTVAKTLKIESHPN